MSKTILELNLIEQSNPTSSLGFDGSLSSEPTYRGSLKDFYNMVWQKRIHKTHIAKELHKTDDADYGAGVTNTFSLATEDGLLNNSNLVHGAVVHAYITWEERAVELQDKAGAYLTVDSVDAKPIVRGYVTGYTALTDDIKIFRNTIGVGWHFFTYDANRDAWVLDKELGHGNITFSEGTTGNCRGSLVLNGATWSSYTPSADFGVGKYAIDGVLFPDSTHPTKTLNLVGRALVTRSLGEGNQTQDGQAQTYVFDYVGSSTAENQNRIIAVSSGSTLALKSGYNYALGNVGYTPYKKYRLTKQGAGSMYVYLGAGYEPRYHF